MFEIKRYVENKREPTNESRAKLLKKVVSGSKRRLNDANTSSKKRTKFH